MNVSIIKKGWKLKNCRLFHETSLHIVALVRNTDDSKTNWSGVNGDFKDTLDISVKYDRYDTGSFNFLKIKNITVTVNKKYDY